MTTRIAATELSRRLSDILNRVRYRDERFLVERNGEPIAVLGPAVTQPANITLADLVSTLHNSGPLDRAFADDLEEIQSRQPRADELRWPN
jgi:prevent-host-death family protein